MKKTIIAFAAILLVMACSKKESTDGLHITGNIKGLKNGTLYIQRIVDTSLVVIDSIKIPALKQRISKLIATKLGVNLGFDL